MRYLRFTMIALALFVLCETASAQTPSPDRPNEQHVRQTVTAFWQALGDFDPNGLRGTLDLPNMIIQTRPDKGTRAGIANTDAAAFDAEVRRTIEGQLKGQKGDFYGTTVSKIEVRFLNPTLAYAYHVCRLGGKGGQLAESRGSRDFEAIAVLRASGEATNPWKIVLVTIPQ